MVKTDTAPIGVSVPAAPDIRMASSLFEPQPAIRETSDEGGADRKRGSVTAPWWLLGVAGAGLLAIGAVIATMARPHPAIVSASEVSAPAPIHTPAAVVVEPMPARSPVTIEPLGVEESAAAAELAAPEVPAPVVTPAAVARNAPAPVRRARAASPKRDKPVAATEPASPPPSSAATWVDPFAN